MVKTCHIRPKISSIINFVHLKSWKFQLETGQFWPKFPPKHWKTLKYSFFSNTHFYHFPAKNMFLKTVHFGQNFSWQVKAGYFSKNPDLIKNIKSSTFDFLWPFLVKNAIFLEKKTNSFKCPQGGSEELIIGKILVNSGFKTWSSTLLSDYWTWMYRRPELGRNLEFWQLKDRF